jgi:hypothetical protein
MRQAFSLGLIYNIDTVLTQQVATKLRKEIIHQAIKIMPA